MSGAGLSITDEYGQELPFCLTPKELVLLFLSYRLSLQPICTFVSMYTCHYQIAVPQEQPRQTRLTVSML